LQIPCRKGNSVCNSVGVVPAKGSWTGGKVATEQKRPHTEAERVTICLLAALEHALARLSQ